MKTSCFEDKVTESLIVEIFKFLPLKQLCANLPGVSKNFNKIFASFTKARSVRLEIEIRRVVEDKLLIEAKKNLKNLGNKLPDKVESFFTAGKYISSFVYLGTIFFSQGFDSPGQTELFMRSAYNQFSCLEKSPQEKKLEIFFILIFLSLLLIYSRNMFKDCFQLHSRGKNKVRRLEQSIQNTLKFEEKFFSRPNSTQVKDSTQQNDQNTNLTSNTF